MRKGFCIHCVEVRDDWDVEGIEEWANVLCMMSDFKKGKLSREKKGFYFFQRNLFELLLQKLNWQASTSQCNRHLSC